MKMVETNMKKNYF